MRGILGARIVRSATFGDPDATCHCESGGRAYALMFIRAQNRDVHADGNLVEQLVIENPHDFNLTGNSLGGANVAIDELGDELIASYAVIFPSLADTALPLIQRFRISPEWAAAHPGVGPDLLRPPLPSPAPPPPPSPQPLEESATAPPPPPMALTLPSAPPPTVAVSVVFSLLAAGDVAEYTPSVLSAIEASIATAAGVDASAVHVTASAGSVLLAVEIATSSDQAVAITDAVATQLASPSAATALLAGVASGTIVITDLVSAPAVQPTLVAPSHPPPPLPLVTSAPIAAIAGASAGVAALAAIGLATLLLSRRSKARRRSQALASGQAASTGASSGGPCCYRLAGGVGGVEANKLMRTDGHGSPPPAAAHEPHHEINQRV